MVATAVIIVRATMRQRALEIVDSNATLLVLLLANFFLLEVVDDERWAVIGSTLLGALALVIAISEPASGHEIKRRHAVTIAICVLLAPVVLVVNSEKLVGLTYLLPAALLVTATLPVTLSRVLRHRHVRFETILGAGCIFILVALLFAFVYIAVAALKQGPFFAQPGSYHQSDFVYFSFVVITTLGFGDLSPTSGLPQALPILEALIGQVFLVTLLARLVTLWVREPR